MGGDSSVDLLHGHHDAELLALPHRPGGPVRLHVEQLEAQTCREQNTASAERPGPGSGVGWSRGATFSPQVDPAVDGRLVRVGVDGDLPVEGHVKRSVDGGSVSAHDVQTLVAPGSSEAQRTYRG